MPLTVSHCTPSDAAALGEAVVATYESQPRHIVTFGNVPRPRQVSIFTDYFSEIIASQDHPTPTKENHMLKVTDSSDAEGEIMSYAIWTWLPKGYIFEEDSFADVKEVPEGANVRMMKEFGILTGELRAKHEGRRGPHWSKSFFLLLLFCKEVFVGDCLYIAVEKLSDCKHLN